MDIASAIASLVVSLIPLIAKAATANQLELEEIKKDAASAINTFDATMVGLRKALDDHDAVVDKALADLEAMKPQP